MSQSVELFNTDFRRLTSWSLLRHLGEEGVCWNVDWPMSVYTRACQRVDVRVGGVCSFELLQQRQVDANEAALTETEITVRERGWRLALKSFDSYEKLYSVV